MSRCSKCGAPSVFTLCDKCGDKEQRRVGIAAIIIFGGLGIIFLGSFLAIAIGVGKAFWSMN